MELGTVDLSDNASFAHGFPHEYFTWLRENAPFYWHPPTEVTPDREGFWVASRFADVNAIIMDPKTYSSDKAGTRQAGGTALKDEITAGKILNQTDDPYHRRLRALVNSGFTFKAVAALEHELRRRTRELLSTIEIGDSFNFCTRVSREIPTQAICIVLGVPETDRIWLCDLIDRGIESPSASVIANECANEVRRYAQSLIEHKRAQPDDDIFSQIVHATFEADGSTLNDYELRSFFSLLFPAGAETATRAISGGMLALFERPAQWQRFCNNPSCIKTMVEEIVRWTTPSAYKRRTATRDLSLHGANIHEGDKVTVWEMSANRDERMFERPFDFDIERSPNKHIGFGAGVHFCLGASLARLELTVVLEELAKCRVDFELDGTPQWVPNNRLVGLKQLPVRVIASGR